MLFGSGIGGGSGNSGEFTYTLTREREINLTNDHNLKWDEGEYEFVIEDSVHQTLSNFEIVPLYDQFTDPTARVMFFCMADTAYFYYIKNNEYNFLIILSNCILPVTLTVKKVQ